MMLASLALAAAVQAADPVRSPAPASGPAKALQEPQDLPPNPLDPRPEKAPARKGPEELRVRGGLRIAYNSNIIRLSEKEIDQLESGTRPDKYRIDEVDDIIFTPWGEISLRLDLFADPSRAGLRLKGHLFQHATFASHGEVDLFFEHENLEVEYSYENSIYRREYRNLDTGLFESAFYDEHQLEGSYRIRVAEDVRLKPKLGLRLRDYDDPFNHRDAVEVEPALQGVYEAAPWLKLSAELGLAFQDAFASSSQPDTSYRETFAEAKATALPHKTVELSAAYRLADRRYTTNNDPAVDPGHRDRTDDRRLATLAVLWKISKTVQVDAAAKFTRVSSDTPSEPDATSEETDWSRDEYLVGVQVAF
jgi:hypothetical protein